MKWQPLSEAGTALVLQLAEDSKVWLGRPGKMASSVRALRNLGEPASIPVLLDYVLDADRGVAAEAAAALEELFKRMPLQLLPALDEKIREQCRWSISPASVVPTIHHFPVGADPAILLGLASCHWSGYLRQAAVVRLDREVNSGREIPFLLLRLSDWVSQVREAARKAIRRRLTKAHRSQFIESLPVLVRIRYRSRVDSLLTRIDELLQADVFELARAFLSSDDRATLYLGLDLAWNSTGENAASKHPQLIEMLLQSDDAGVRLHAASRLAHAETAPDLARRFLPQLLNDRSVAVRRLALNWLANGEPEAHLATLHEALLDRSAMIRSIAQFYLPKVQSFDLRNFYRNAIDRKDTRIFVAALGGLGETGESADVDLVLPLIHTPDVKLRKAAIVALAKLALKEHLEIFIAALQDPSPGVSRHARIALESVASSIGRDRLGEIFASARQSHTQMQALALINRLSKWQKLPLLIEAFGRYSEEKVGITAQGMLKSWLRGYNRTHFLQPAAAEIESLRKALAAYAPQLEYPISSELHGIAASMR